MIDLKKLEEDLENKILKVGDEVEGVTISNEQNSLLVDLGSFGTGIIFGKEYLIIRDLIKNIVPGTKITAKIVELEGKDGYVELSLREAKEAEVWQDAILLMKENKPIYVAIKEANKGGLIVNWQGLTGFIPVSQLSEDNYPKVSGGDKNRILSELQKFVGTRMMTVIITVEPEENKIIFSEKKLKESDISKVNDTKQENINNKEEVNMIKKYSIGDVLEVEIIGVVDFGVFCKLPAGDEGLIHISEISWSLVTDIKDIFHVGEKITAKIIELNKEKISLSIKALTENPWNVIKGKYKEGDNVEGIVIKISDHGALISVEEGIYGLVHISEFKDLEELQSKLNLGERYKFNIKVFNIEEEKMILGYKD